MVPTLLTLLLEMKAETSVVPVAEAKFKAFFGKEASFSITFNRFSFEILSLGFLSHLKYGEHIFHRLKFSLATKILILSKNYSLKFSLYRLFCLKFKL